MKEENRKLKELLAEQILEVATLREILGQTSDAQNKKEGRELRDR